MFKGIVIGFVLAVILGVGAGYLTIVSGAIPANADAKPGHIERWIAGASLRATLKAEAPKGANPIALSDANLTEGLRLYAINCAICHGSAKGASSASPIAKGEYPAPPQFGSHGVEDDPEGWSFWKIKYGIRLTGMPSWKGVLDDNQIWTLALFLKHMDKLPPAVETEWKALPAPELAAPGSAASPSAAPMRSGG